MRKLFGWRTLVPTHGTGVKEAQAIGAGRGSVRGLETCSRDQSFLLVRKCSKTRLSNCVSASFPVQTLLDLIGLTGLTRYYNQYVSGI